MQRHYQPYLRYSPSFRAADIQAGASHSPLKSHRDPAVRNDIPRTQQEAPNGPTVLYRGIHDLFT